MGKSPSRGNSVSKWLKEGESKAHGRNCNYSVDTGTESKAAVIKDKRTNDRISGAR